MQGKIPCIKYKSLSDSCKKTINVFKETLNDSLKEIINVLRIVGYDVLFCDRIFYAQQFLSHESINHMV